ncbi:hypothetical protein [Streptomyces sp. BPTC-684]|uniref:hypothetical protein n=1 Tax=Streptomyces sp. BPTC-684 TaxID=3043734 RepID=UPI0024B1B71B|nr:hypothetical protein [Streptomyces sp. BPTC-684]WHM37844.1 hypothetical protein QIY60_13630 [Streptomyces sp. BPTC-684]
MSAHAAMPTGSASSRPGPSSGLAARFGLPPALIALPVVIGVFYGFWAASINRRGGEVTGANIALGLVSGAVIAALGLGLLMIQGRLPRELRAAAFGTLFGAGTGFLYAQSGESVFGASMMGALLGGGMMAAAFYVFYTRE